MPIAIGAYSDTLMQSERYGRRGRACLLYAAITDERGPTCQE